MNSKKDEIVSIIMNCHNGDKYLKKSISSVLKQSYKKWELIFFDNKSNDNSRKIISNYKDKRIKIFKSKKYLKLYEARNEAIKKAQGKYICFLDTDDWWAPKKIEIQLKTLIKNKYDMVYSNFFNFYQSSGKKEISKNLQLPSGLITQQLLDNYVVGILTVLIKKKFFNKKMFNKKYEIVGDFDYIINFSIDNKIGSIQQPLAYYRLHEKNFSHLKIKLYIKELKNWIRKNSYKLEKKNFNLDSQKKYLLKLKVKNFLKYGII
tara:strand:+ start:153 stop:941 length:789 start_codon:yes stop_codon:yes gene_type:complete